MNVKASRDMVGVLTAQHAFSRATFGDRDRTLGVVDHLQKELREIVDAKAAGEPTLPEWVDAIILSMDGALRAAVIEHTVGEGETDSHERIAVIVFDALTDKMHTNRELRKWPSHEGADPNKAIEHDRSGE